MADVRAFRSGNWSDTNLATSPWSNGSAIYAPAAGDNVYSNTFTITVDTSVNLGASSFVTNGSATSRTWKDGGTATATAGGTYSLNNGVTLTSNVSALNGNAAAATITLSSTNSASIVGNVTGPNTNGLSGSGTIVNNGSGTLTIIGNITGASGGLNAITVYNGSLGVISITGNVVGGAASSLTITNNSTGTISITGNVTAGTSATATGAYNASTGTFTIIGNVTASAAVGANNASTGTFTIIGNITASSGANGFTAAGGTNRLSVNAINALNGTAAIYAASYLVSPVPYNGYIRYANDGTNYLNQFTTDSLSAFSMPPVSAVRAGVQFANNTLTGTCQIPAAASVSFGVPVDTTVGTAALNPVDFMNVSLASLTATDSLGARLKNSATVESVGRIIASFSN